MQTHPDADTGSSCELASVSSDTSPTLNFSFHKILMVLSYPPLRQAFLQEAQLLSVANGI